MTTETKTVRCESCGRELQIPSDLETFSCLYCGAKQRAPVPSCLPADEADREYAEAHLLDCIRDFPNAYRQFDRKHYEDSFRAHLEAIRPTFEAMDRYVCSQPGRREELLEGFAKSFVAQWEEYHARHPKAKHRAARERLAFADKLTLAWYTVPAIRELGLSVGEDFVRALHRCFNARYPENSFEPGSYAEIRSGFRRRGLLGLFSRRD